MRYTNKSNLPQYIVDWLTHDDYDHNDDEYTLSTTTLMKPVQAHWLTLRYGDQIEMDASDLIAARLGQAVHDSIEKVSTSDVIKEQRISKTIDINGSPYTITGRFDILAYRDGLYVLRDIKTTSVWSYILGGKDEEYRKQLSTYRWLLAGRHEVEPLGYIDFFFTDWQSAKVRQDNRYPQRRVLAGHEVPLMSLDETQQYIHGRASLFDRYRETPDSLLPPCTLDELWAEEEKFAVTKTGAKRATKLCSTRDEAERYMTSKKIKGFVEHRPPKVKRCKYCPAVSFCHQARDLQQRNLIAF
jgi:hypothetical protein